jgi:hypothetical protein
MRSAGRVKASKTKSGTRSASDARSGVGHDRHSDADDEEGRPPQRPTPSARAPSAAATPSSEQGLKAPPSVALRSVPTVLLADDLRNSDRGVTETRIISESRTAAAAAARFDVDVAGFRISDQQLLCYRQEEPRRRCAEGRHALPRRGVHSLLVRPSAPATEARCSQQHCKDQLHAVMLREVYEAADAAALETEDKSIGQQRKLLQGMPTRRRSSCIGARVGWPEQMYARAQRSWRCWSARRRS